MSEAETWAQPSWTDVLAAVTVPDSEQANKNNYSFGECNPINKSGAVMKRNTGETREAAHSSQGGPLS